MFPMLLASGVAMVSLVVSPGKAVVVDRQEIGRSLIAGLAQLTLCPGISVGALLLLMMAWFGQSLNPVAQNTLKQSVETFDTAPHLSASWKPWEVAAAWLADSGVQFDHSKPRRLFEAKLDGEQNAGVLKSAFRTGLIRPEDSIRLRDLNQKKNDVIYESAPTARSYESLRKSGLLGNPILSLDQYDSVIKALIITNQLSESERNLWETRLLATFRDTAKSEFHLPIQDALNVTQLLEVIGRSRHIGEFRPSIHGLLVDFQCLEYQRFQSSGGFRGYPGIDTSDDDATTAAVELMQYYGVPKELDLVALRSFLRPTTHDRLKLSRSNLRGGVHKATLLRLESLPDAPPVTLWDYLRHKRNFGAAILLVLSCCYATLSAPIRSLEGSAITDRITPAG